MMDQNSGDRGMRNDQGNEDTTEAREHVHAAEENRDALEAQNRRTEATAPDSVSTPVGGDNNGMNAAGSPRASDDPSQARENLRHAEENRDALAEQSRRVEASAPDDIDTGRR